MIADTTRRVSVWTTDRIVTVSVFFVLTWVGKEFDPRGLTNFWYGNRIAGIPSQYFFLAALTALVAAPVMRRPRLRVIRRLGTLKLALWTVLGMGAIGFAVARAVTEGVSEPFADWRNFAVMGLGVVLTSRWLAPKPWAKLVMVDFAIVVGLASFVPIVLWVGGGGGNTVGIRVPVFDGPTLQVSAFAAMVTSAVWLGGAKDLPRAYTTAVKMAALGSTAVVLMSLRRSYWVIWVVGIAILLLLQLRRRGVSSNRAYAGVGALILAGGLVAAALGPDVVADRIESFSPNATNRFTVTNADHVGDVLDALDVIEEEPLLGFGIGKYYSTSRITAWKTTSFEVHNAFVHTWLKFGLVGLIAYAGFHFRLVERLLAYRREPGYVGLVMPAVGAFLVGEIVASLFGTTWYASLQLTMLRVLILGVLIALVPAVGRRRRS